MNAPTRLPAGPATPARARFVHLKVHSAYSLLEGALPIGKLAKLAAAHSFPAVGLTDTNNLYGALEFSDKLAETGIQPIVGVTLTVDFEDRRSERDISGVPAMRQPGDGNIALLAMDEVGYANLMKLVSRAHLDAADVETAHTTAAVLAAHAAGLIALTGGPDGPIDRALRDSQSALAEARLDRLKAMFGDRLYVEIQRHGLKSEHDVEPQLLKLAYAKHIPHRRHQRNLFRHARRLRGARCAPVHRRRPLRGRGRPPPRHARARLQERRGDGGGVRRLAGGARQHHRDRQALRLPARRAASRSCRASSPSPTR